jgi:hypothetical protein
MLIKLFSNRHYILVINRDAAWNEILKLEGFGIGGSKSNSLFWAASRLPPLQGYNSTPHSPDLQGSVRPFCSGNSACDAAGKNSLCI